jgi:hypothetical protein
MVTNGAEPWRAIVASSLDWHEAHASLEAAAAGLPAELRGRRPERLPHSPWELVEHIRRTQADLLEFMVNAAYAAPAWPDDYWPAGPTPPTKKAWEESLVAIRSDRQRLQEFARRMDVDLVARIPWGEGQTYLRTILVALDHTSYHVGQLVAVRRLLGAWPAA